MRIFYIQLFFSCAKPFSCVCTFGMFIEQPCFASIQNYFIHTPNVVCAYNIVEYTNIVLYTYTIFFFFPRYDKKLTCCVFDPSLLHPTVSHHELARNTFTFIYKHMYLRDLEEDSFHSYPGPPICILLY